MATRAPTPLLATKEEAADLAVVATGAAGVVPVEVPVGVVAVVGEVDAVGVVIVGVVAPDVAVPLAVPDEASENETGLGVTLAVAVTERLTISKERMSSQALVGMYKMK